MRHNMRHLLLIQDCLSSGIWITLNAADFIFPMDVHINEFHCGTFKVQIFDLVFILMYGLTKMSHFLTCKNNITNKEMTQLLLENVYKY